ncbi:MAG: AmmeMemoRadiSam system protein B [Eubacteriales bacterium]|nr:AmmeMemoRadiSam system protein B [Eubacteriales bacterium]
MMLKKLAFILIIIVCVTAVSISVHDSPDAAAVFSERSSEENSDGSEGGPSDWSNAGDSCSQADSASDWLSGWEETGLSRQPELPPIPCIFYEESSFLNAVSASVVFQEGVNGLKGGILPHHLLASDMIASFWKTVSQGGFDLIIIIGPDHNKMGRAAITTVSSSFSTAYGDVEVDKNISDLLINDNIALEDAQIMEQDHSISSHMPFIKYYMPDTPVLPLLIYGNCSTQKISALSDKLMNTVEGKNVLYVASMDFSHYLPLEQANEMDAITEKALSEFDYDGILEMTNDNLDSRPSALLLLYTMSGLNAKSMVKWDHSNSDIISKTRTGYTTSYFDFGFFEE